MKHRTEICADGERISIATSCESDGRWIPFCGDIVCHREIAEDAIERIRQGWNAIAYSLITRAWERELYWMDKF